MLQRSLYEYENVIKILLFILNVQIEYKQEGLSDNITHGHTDCVDWVFADYRATKFFLVDSVYLFFT